jgi:hypothetical protein
MSGHSVEPRSARSASLHFFHDRFTSSDLYMSARLRDNRVGEFTESEKLISGCWGNLTGQQLV